MQTLEFTRALRTMRDELKVLDLTGVVAPWLNPGSSNNIDENQKNRFAALLFESNAAYERLVRNSVAGPILQKLRVSEVYEPSRLRTMLTTISGVQTSQQIVNSWQAYAAFYSFLELLQSFLKWESAAHDLLEEPKTAVTTTSDEIVEMELVEYADETGISPRRLEVFAKSIKQLHTHLTVLYGIDNDKVTFKYFDSGSDVRVGIECAKTIAQTLSTLFKEWWDKILFWRYESFDKKIEAISKGLTLVGTIHESVSKGAISLEVAENLKLRIFREVENLTQIGATVPLKVDATINQRQLLTEVRNTKLLTEGTSAETSEIRVTDGEPPKQA